MKEEKFDRILRKTFNDKFISEPEADFTDKVMDRMGVKKKESTVRTRPLKPGRGLLLMAILYLFILALVFFIPGSFEKVSSFNFPEFKLPSLSQYISLSSGISKLLVVLILGGWALIFFDNYIRKYFTR